jgi:hypothetical protein
MLALRLKRSHCVNVRGAADLSCCQGRSRPRLRAAAAVGALAPRRIAFKLPGRIHMDENRVTGTAKNLGGKVEEGLGRIPGICRPRSGAGEAD